MFEKIAPEQAGISSERVADFIAMLERRGMNTHSLLMMKGDALFAEYYWTPFHKDFCHRMYSQTKSYVGIAIGLLMEEGKLRLDQKIGDFFPEYDSSITRQTVRQMLTMTTVNGCPSWFTAGDPDRTHLYFQPRAHRPAGTLWQYDSAGSQVLACLVEKLSGKSLLDYLREKLFVHMGTFQTAQMLKTPNGDSWGDSALLCTLRDMASFGRLLMKGGNWEGKQLIPADYVKEATSKQVDNREDGYGGVMNYGYGYQIWRVEKGFAFIGMGGQLTLCLPEQDLLFSITADNQGNPAEKHIVIGGFMDLIAPYMGKPLPEDGEAQAKLQEVTRDLKLRSMQGEPDSPLREEISGKVYTCAPNPTGITRFSFVFHDAARGEFRYTNAQGDKVIPFGVNHNVFGKFPQLGYSDDPGVTPTANGFMYNDAVSLCWAQPNRIILYVHIIDRYFGNLCGVFGFAGDTVACRFEKAAEYFLEEYKGSFIAKEE